MNEQESEWEEQALPWRDGQLSPCVAFFRNAILCHFQQLRKDIVKNNTEIVSISTM